MLADPEMRALKWERKDLAKLEREEQAVAKQEWKDNVESYMIFATFHVRSSSIKSVLNCSRYGRQPSSNALLYVFSSGIPL